MLIPCFTFVLMALVVPGRDGFMLQPAGVISTPISLNMLVPQNDHSSQEKRNNNKALQALKSGDNEDKVVSRRLPYPIILNRNRQRTSSPSSSPPALSAAGKGGAATAPRPSNRYSSWRLAPVDHFGGPFEHNKYAVRKFTELYTQRSDTYFQSNIIYTWNIVLGLVQHRRKYGSPLCPCRQYKNKIAEVHAAYWNCPCVPMRERKECACLLFLTPDSPFVGDKQTFTDDEVRETYFTSRVG